MWIELTTLSGFKLPVNTDYIYRMPLAHDGKDDPCTQLVMPDGAELIVRETQEQIMKKIKGGTK